MFHLNFLWREFLLGVASMICVVQCHHSKDHHGHTLEPKFTLEDGKELMETNMVEYYMYNVTNPDEVEDGAKPVLDQVGPYRYKETRRKFNVRQVAPGVLRYQVYRYWEFLPELSGNRDESDLFNVINIPMVILSTKLAAKNLPVAFNNILVDELLEKGDTKVRRNEEFGNIIYHGMNVSIYTEILSDILQGNVPTEFANGLFALYKSDNSSLEGEYDVQSSGPNTGSILKFNNETKLKYWSGDHCNKIDGTDGYYFRPGINEKSTLKIFYSELCRSVYLKYSGKTEYKGIPVDMFKFPEDLLEDPEVEKENKCFCSRPLRYANETTCLKRGFIDFSTCKKDSPLLLSFPHFLDASEEYKEQSVGIKPVREKHETIFYVEPKTGKIVKSDRKFQFNVKLRPLDNIDYLRNLTRMIFPVFWTRKTNEASQTEIEDLKEQLKKLAEIEATQDLQDEPQSDQPSDDINSITKRLGTPDETKSVPHSEVEGNSKLKPKVHSRNSSSSSMKMYLDSTIMSLVLTTVFSHFIFI